MNKKYKQLVIDFLKEAEDQLGNNGCNDWEFPKDWTQDEIKEFYATFSKANCPPDGDGEDYSQDIENRYMADFCVVSTLIHLLEKERK